MIININKSAQHTLLVLGTAVAISTLSACSSASANSKSNRLADPQSSRTAVQNLQWGKTPFGPDASVVYGDFSKGKHITLIKFPAGMKTPIHTHSHDYIGVVISGVTRHYLPGKPETKTTLAAGSHWNIPGKVQHISECLPGAECVMALYQDKNFDFLPSK